MTFNIQVDTELISTSMVETAQPFNEDSYYIDGDEVAKDGSVYHVGVTITKTDAEKFISDGSYSPGGMVYMDGDSTVYKCIKSVSLNPSSIPNLVTSYVCFPSPPAIWPGSFLYTNFGSFGTLEDNGIEHFCSPTGPVYRRDTFTLIADDSYEWKVEIYNAPGGSDSSPSTSTVTIHKEFSSSLTTDDFFLEGGTLYQVLQPLALPNPDDYDMTDYFETFTSLSVRTYDLTYVRPVYDYAPFDQYQYSMVEHDGSQTWVIRSNGPFNCIALGKLSGDETTVVFKDAFGTVVDSVLQNPINDSINGNVAPEPITDIIYSSDVVEANGTATITIAGDSTKIGKIFPAISIEAGYTNLKMKFTIKNYDRVKTSIISGSEERIKGQRSIIYTGSFEFPIASMSTMVLIAKKYVQTIISMDGTDMINNEIEDGESMFDTTKIVGWLRKLEIENEVSGNDMSEMGVASFEIEEIV